MFHALNCRSRFLLRVDAVRTELSARNEFARKTFVIARRRFDLEYLTARPFASLGRIRERPLDGGMREVSLGSFAYQELDTTRAVDVLKAATLDIRKVSRKVAKGADQSLAHAAFFKTHPQLTS
jgi:hypothetical protein